MSDSEEIDEANLPSAAVCGERCNKFAELTGTDTALAMFYLQDREWDLDRALNAYFGENSPSSSSGASSSKKESPETQSDGKSRSSAVADPEYHRIRVLSWNIDGLDTGNLKTRTVAACDLINKENPQVVFLQEVVPSTLEIIEEKCSTYHVIPSNHVEYFTAILLKVEASEYEDHQVIPFFTSRMGRNLLSVKCEVKGIKCQLFTSHLESTKDHVAERKRQLKTAFKAVNDSDRDRAVIFGGDLNLRDKELADIGGIPYGVYDVWEITGKRPEALYTWDTTRNDNLGFDIKFKARNRFDRLYIRHSRPTPLLKPVYFELIGLERLPCHRFPSDHWGILSHYNVISRVPK